MDQGVFGVFELDLLAFCKYPFVNKTSNRLIRFLNTTIATLVHIV